MNTNLKPQIEDLSCFGFFSEFDGQQLDSLLQNASYLDINRGETLYNDGGSHQQMYCLLSGRVKIGLTASSGNERIVDIVLPGMTFGESGCFSQKEMPVYAQAMVASLLLVIDKNAIIETIRQWPEVSVAFLELAHARIHSLLDGMYACCLRSAEQRINDYLIQHAEPLSTDRIQAVVNLPANKSVIASSLNLSPETFSRQLHRLENDGVVRVDRHSVHIFDLHDIRKRCLS